MSRDEAARLVVDELVGDDAEVVVLGLDQPLSAGESIDAYRPADMTEGTEGTEAGASLTATGDAWFFWIDDEPGARFDHPSRFVLVDRKTGELTSVDARWWPVLDGVGLWTDDDEYWSGDDWVHATIETTTMRRGALLHPTLPVLDCSTGGGHGVVINGWEDGESGRKDFDNDGANMNDAFEGAGLDTTYFGPSGSENVDITFDKKKVEDHLAMLAMGLGAGDTLVIYVGGHGWVSKRLGETQVGAVWESDLEEWLAKFDPAVEIVVMIDGCHGGGMLDSLSCVADLAVTSTDEEKSAYGDLDFDSDTNPQDNGGEWTSSMLTCWNTIFEDQSGIDEVKGRADAGGHGFFRQLVGECFEGAGQYDDVAKRGLTAPQSQNGAEKTAGTAVLPEPPVCEPTDPTDPTDPTNPTDPVCEVDELATIAMALGEILGSPSAGAAVCDAATESPSGNDVLYSDGVKIGVAEGDVDLLFHGHLLEIELPSIDEVLPCDEESQTAPTLCPYETSSAEGSWVGVFAAFDGPIPQESPTRYYQYGIVFDADGDTSNNYEPPSSWPADFYDGTDRWLQVSGDPSYGWTFDVLDARNGAVYPMPSAARAMILGNGLLVLVPRSELGAAPQYRVTSFHHEGDWGQSGPWSADLSSAVGEPLRALE